MNFTSGDEEELTVNLAPLIDVVFLLLIFFMVTTTFNRNAAIDITLPEADATAPKSQQLRVFVNVNALGEIAIQPEGNYPTRLIENADVKRIALEILQTIEQSQKGQTLTEPVIVIHADKDAQHGKVIELMEAVGLAGLSQIEFAVKPVRR
ncbi:MAG: biopolymer transport protein ExbD [Saprospiraceae bacterium]|jgi:biopolymer transport protein ExbD